ncbi:MAG: hypothetical protein JF602_06265 [Gemmatimonadetes bacterium]|nr:hypothetical protein [Gemmatimonadota bacterium]
MIMMTVPLLLLYEVGVAGSALVHRRRKAAMAAGVVLLALMGWPSGQASAQVPGKKTPAQLDSIRVARAAQGDTAGTGQGAIAPGQSLDSATAKRLGIPTAPTRSFASPDSVTQSLLDRPGYRATRYRADTATVFVREQRVHLQGQALTERQGASLEADSITYLRDSCTLDAAGDPHLFDRGQVLVGVGIRYDTCRRRGTVLEALTNFTEGSTVWFLRGNVAQDSSSSRIYAG